jgi:hypothetical protein
VKRKRKRKRKKKRSRMKLYRNAEKERRIQNAIEARISARYERILRRELKAASKEGADAYKKGRSVDAAVQAQDARIEKALRSMWTAGFQEIGQRVDGQITQAVKGYKPKEYKREMSDTFRVALDNFIRRYMAKKITQIGSTTRKQIEDDVKKGIAEGLSVDEIGSLIAKHGAELAGYRANLIARTEVHSAAQNGSLSVAKESGVVEFKEWISVEDGRTRGQKDNDEFDHVNVEPVPINDKFVIRGQFGDAMLEYPGDPSGPAGAIINCRCALGYIVR